MGTTLLLGVADLSTLTSKETTATQKLVTKITARKTSARMATFQRNQIEVGTTMRMTSRYGKIDACEGTKR